MNSVNMMEDGAMVTITGSGELTLSNTQEFGNKLKEAAASADIVVVDLRPAAFIDSAVLQYMVAASRLLTGRGKRLRVRVAEGGYPLRVLEIVGFSNLMDIEAESPETAGDDDE